MTTWPEHPTLHLRLTEEQRDRAISWLQQAYADGRISEQEFDRRIGQVLQADTRKELNLAFYGLVDVPRRTAVAVPGAGSAVAARGRSNTLVGAVAWFGSLVSMFVLPLVLYIFSGHGTKNRAIIADCLNFQLFSLLVFAAGSVVTGLLGLDWLGAAVAVYSAVWLVLSIIGGIKALNGEVWHNPVTRLLSFRPVKN